MTYEEAGDLKLQLNNVRVDNKVEKNCKHLLKNRKLKIFYQEWNVWQISWYNMVLDESITGSDDRAEDKIEITLL